MGKSYRARLRAAAEIVAAWLAGFAGLLGVVLIFLNMVQVTLRATIRFSFVWVPELSVFLGLWIVFLGTATMFLRSGEIQVTALVNLLPKAVQKAIDIAIAAISAFFGVALFMANLKYKQIIDMTKPHYVPVRYSFIALPVYVLALSIVYWALDSAWQVLEGRGQDAVAAADGLADGTSSL